MVSGPLKKFGLKAGLQELCTAVESASGINVELNVLHLDHPIPLDQRVSLYRIVQEILANAMRHSQASKVVVQAIRSGNSLSLMVTDDGIGFDPEAIPENEGMGLKNIRSRVAKLEGHIEIDSNRGNGTSISIEVEVKDAPDDQSFVD